MSDIQIIIKDRKGKEKNLTVKNTDSIRTAKEKAQDLDYVWVFNGEPLKDDKSIEYYGIESDDIIVKGERVPGGKTQYINYLLI